MENQEQADNFEIFFLLGNLSKNSDGKVLSKGKYNRLPYISKAEGRRKLKFGEVGL